MTPPYLISSTRLAHLEAAAQEESESALARLRELIAEGEASPDVDASVVHAELMARAKVIDAVSE